MVTMKKTLVTQCGFGPRNSLYRVVSVRAGYNTPVGLSDGFIFFFSSFFGQLRIMVLGWHFLVVSMLFLALGVFLSVFALCVVVVLASFPAKLVFYKELYT